MQLMPLPYHAGAEVNSSAARSALRRCVCLHVCGTRAVCAVWVENYPVTPRSIRGRFRHLSRTLGTVSKLSGDSYLLVVYDWGIFLVTACVLPDSDYIYLGPSR